MSQLQFRARCIRSHHPQVLLVGEQAQRSRGERYFALDPEQAVHLAGELMEAARQAYHLETEAPTTNRKPRDPSTPAPVNLNPEPCRYVPENCPLPVCLCRPYPIPAEQVQQLCDLRKLVAPFGFRHFWMGTVSDAQETAITEAESAPVATLVPALPVAD